MPNGLAPSPELVWFRGPDAIRFVNDLISQEIGGLAPGAVVPSLLLGPQGKLDFILWVLRGDEEVGLVTEDGRGDELAQRFGRYRIRVKADIEPEEGEIALVVSDAAAPPVGWLRDRGVVRADLSWDNLARELRVGGATPDLPPVDRDQYTKARIEAGVPIFGVDIDEKTIPQETGLVAATVAFDKGCFLGQELVARLDSRGGRVNRHLRILDFDAPVPEGAVVSAGDREVGTVTSSAGGAGLALLWREVEPGDRVKVGETEATVREAPQKNVPPFTGP